MGTSRGRPSVSFFHVRLPVDERPGPAVGFIDCGDQDVGIQGIHDEIAHAAIAEVEGQRPGPPAVRRLIKASLAVHLVVVEFPFGGDIDDIRVFRVHGDLGDEEALLQADRRPGLSGIGRFPHPVAVGARTGVHGFAGPEVEDIRVRRSDGQEADAHIAELFEDGPETDAVPT